VLFRGQPEQTEEEDGQNQKADAEYLKNAYRVLLTRARQGMVIVVPEGTEQDPTRDPAFYDGTYSYLRSVGIEELGSSP
jgi:hypothetical protein